MTSRYKDIVNMLELEIRQMQIDGRSKLPTEKELCSTYSCSRQTIRNALDVLEDKGLIVRRRGSGSFIADTSDKPCNKVFFITEDEDSYIYPALISQLKNTLNDKKYELITCSTNGSYSAEREILSDIITQNPAAVIIDPISSIIPNPNTDLIGRLTDNNIKVIYLYSSYPYSENSIVISEDNSGGSRLLVCHLADRGLRNIAGIFRLDDTRGLERFRGCIDTIRDLGLEFNESAFCMYSHNELRQLQKGHTEFIQRFAEEHLTRDMAVVCQNDIIAYQLIKVLNERGMKVPDDISVVSFDNSYYATSGSVSITSLGHRDKDVAASLSEAILSSARNRPAGIKSLGWTLHVRNS